MLAAKDLDLALLNYRATPHYATQVPPSVALMGRHLNTRLPVLPETLIPETPNHNQIRLADKRTKEKFKSYYDKHNGARSLPPLHSGDKVLVMKDGRWSKSGVVVGGDVRNRTYVVNSNGRMERRNRKHLQLRPWYDTPPQVQDQAENQHEQQQTLQRSPIITRSRSGVPLRKPMRYRDD